MKILPLILSILTTPFLLFSENLTLSSIGAPIIQTTKTLPEDKKALIPLNKGFFYLKSGATSGVLETDPNLLLGLGYRSKLLNPFTFTKAFAFDINVQVSDKKYHRYNAGEVYLPKINGLYYLTPQKDKSFYLGSGLSFVISDPAYLVAQKDADQFDITKGMVLLSKNAFIGSGLTFIVGRESSLHTKYMNSFQVEMNLPVDQVWHNYYESYSDHWTLNLSYLLGY